ncbi:hypothetical protein B0H16DRAFT_1895180 [Mycena metata]|uniref:Uncharacterized protein n=1 Tax=Mycena metata TaxID=1033252 RepID=A0AAD7MN54_9AGAR|nr:hypothetical protein B0H16DRAFT_1895180 [Mycena metata]
MSGARESFVGVYVENLFYGFYVSLFIESIVILIRTPTSRNRKQMYVLATTILLFALITARCMLDNIPSWIAISDAGIDFSPTVGPVGLASVASEFCVTLVADAFIIFRTFVVWNKNWKVIIVPSLVYAATLGCTIWGLHSLAVFNPADNVFKIIEPYNVFIYLTLITNVLCTLLISYRILTIRRSVSGSLRSDGITSKIITVIVESAAMYTLLLIALLITNSTGSYILYILTDVLPPTIGLVFSYIIIRVSRGTSYGDDSTRRVESTSGRDRQTVELERIDQHHSVDSSVVGGENMNPKKHANASMA